MNLIKNLFHIVVNVNINYQLDYRSKDKDKPWGLATIYHSSLIRNQKKLRIGKKMDENSIKSIK